MKETMRITACAALFALGLACLPTDGWAKDAHVEVNAPAEAQHYQPTKENLESRKEFQDDKFGICR